MKRNKLFCLFVGALLFAGCNDIASPEVRAINQSNVNDPTFVADTPKGKLYQIVIDRGSGRSPDRIYYFENDTNITVNSTVPQGKNRVTTAVLIVNGIEYVPKNE